MKIYIVRENKHPLGTDDEEELTCCDNHFTAKKIIEQIYRETKAVFERNQIKPIVEKISPEEFFMHGKVGGSNYCKYAIIEEHETLDMSPPTHKYQAERRLKELIYKK